jgi:hypothetical protein
MNTQSTSLDADPKRALRQRDEKLFQAIFVLSFPVFLIVVMATRFLPTSGEGKREVSILSEASSSARSTIAIALMD